MILKELKVWNFRKFKADGENPGLSVEFHAGLNALVGENDAGKSAIIDAIKLILQTQSGEYIRVVDEDFHTCEGRPVDEFRIYCSFAEFEPDEAKNFVEYLTYTKKEDGNLGYVLDLHFTARRDNEKGRIYTELRAGDDDDGVLLDGRTRELLKCVYLRPLRDAAKEMRSGRNSRISQILYNHPVFSDKENNALVKIFSDANDQIAQYFSGDETGKVILEHLRDTLRNFSAQQDHVDADLKTSEMRLKPILESLSLMVEETQPGLGVCNLLFIAAELLLLNANGDGALRLALIEELEAHLHPQSQLRLIEYLQNTYNDIGAQIIISTHSPTLASKINLKNIILVRDDTTYSLAPENTQLAKGDYLFLQRFLDTTKANLFFAKSLIMVEGDAENLLLPVIADILGRNLERYGVSVVKIGGVAFHRYAKIFCRKIPPMIQTRIAIVTDCDVKTEKLTNGMIDSKEDETQKKIEKIRNSHDQELIKSFVAPHWTFEYSIAMSCLGKDLHRAVLEASKVSNSDGHPLTKDKMDEINEEIDNDPMSQKTGHDFAYYIYQEKMLDGNISKAITAQCLAAELRKKIIEKPEPVGEQIFDADLFRIRIDQEECKKIKSQIENDEYLKYIVEAIKYVTEP